MYRWPKDAFPSPALCACVAPRNTRVFFPCISPLSFPTRFYRHVPRTLLLYYFMPTRYDNAYASYGCLTESAYIFNATIMTVCGPGRSFPVVARGFLSIATCWCICVNRIVNWPRWPCHLNCVAPRNTRAFFPCISPLSFPTRFYCHVPRILLL